MEKNIGLALKSATSLLHVKKELVKLFKATRNGKGVRIGYVAGIINSEGPNFAETNRKKLTEHTEKLRKLHEFLIFSAIDVLPAEIYNRLEEWKLSFEEREEKVRFFWREILKSRHVTDIFMTPRWEKSKGASDEHKTAKQIGLKIHYVEE